MQIFRRLYKQYFDQLTNCFANELQKNTFTLPFTFALFSVSLLQAVFASLFFSFSTMGWVTSNKRSYSHQAVLVRLSRKLLREGSFLGGGKVTHGHLSNLLR